MSRGRSRGRAAQKAANARAARGGGTLVPMVTSGVPAAAPGTDQEWFGPGRPMAPVAPSSVAGRRLDFQFGTNLNVTPRQSDEFSFAHLRLMADRHDLTRLAIETCKDRMTRLKWGFRVLDSDEDLTPEQEARSVRYRKMLRRPDGKLFWVDWLRSVLEDLLVIDAPAIYVRRTVDETEVVGLCQIDGATIKPVIDAHGNEPDPPETAYQQVLHGMPAVNYTSQQLIYAPRNRRVHKIYGFSPVEQIVAIINIALRRQLWQHSYFTDGNIPDSLIGVPATWTPDQIRDFQDWFDAMLTGNTSRRRGGVFVPGEVAKSYVPTKEAEMFGAGEEWFARVVCFCFGVSHQALVKEVNRATADSAYEQAIEDGLAPVMAWVKSLMDRILIDVLGEEEIEFWWIKDEAIDPKVQDDIWKARVDAGSHTRNEWRTAVGDKPRPEPEADRLLYMGKPLGVEDQIADQQTRMDSGVFPEAIPGDGTGGRDKDKSSDDVVASGGKGDAEEDDKSEPASPTTKSAEGEQRPPFVEPGSGGELHSKFLDDGEGLELEKKETARHPKGSPKGGQFAKKPGAGSVSAKPDKINVHENKDGSHTVYVNGKKDFKGTKAEALAHVSAKTAPPALPTKSADGKKIQIHTNKDGSQTVYVGGKKEFKGSRDEVTAHVSTTHGGGPKVAPTPVASVSSPKPATPAPAPKKEGKWGAGAASGPAAHDAANVSNLSPGEQAALTKYSGHSYQTINGVLRKGLYDPKLKQTITDLDSAFTKARTSREIVVMRGVKGEFYKKLSIGSEFVDKGFTSTSTNSDVAGNFSGGGTVMRIRVPKGSRAISLTKTGTTLYQKEKEILLRRRGRYRVVGFEEVKTPYGTKRIVLVDYKEPGP